MSRSFKLPDLGEGIHEGEVLAVPVEVGQEVKEGDIILEVETDKAAVEIPSPFNGRVQEIYVKPGDVVNVGDVMMTFSNGEDVQTVDEVKPAAKPAAAPEAVAAAAQVSATHKDGPVPASPATRRLARKLGVELHSVTPSGPAGLVTAEDVRGFAAAGKIVEEVPAAASDAAVPVQPGDIAVPPLPDFSKWGEVERVPFRSIRRATARQMSLAWSQIPHVNSQDVVDITRLEAFRQKHKAEIEGVGGKLTITVFAIKAVATALKTYPNFNAALDTKNNEIIIKHYYNVGVAVNTDNGLIVPVVKDVDRKSIKELALELTDLVQRTRQRKTTVEEMQGGTFTITNAGAMGGGFFAPIINHPEVAILGMGQARMQPVVREQEKGDYIIVPRLMMPIVLCIDHRVLDGADSIQFLKILVETLEDPDELLMSMV
ncbi:Dihydrolipoamide acetyltransferase component of pyruvate dehydrogenase complex (EC [Olavius sp. associated proteobacterium Delta 1]|nr:Dihydrolipoamide acetyltransferase component of pyruvate dehydrogenase complex (EC [Olavius sp. associated proteobacterium Delta 1]